MPTIKNVVFDLGNVLIAWDPRVLYRQIFPDEASMNAFLQAFFASGLIDRIDSGEPFARCAEEFVKLYPAYKEATYAYAERFDEALGGLMPDSVALFDDLKQKDVVLYALSNWSVEPCFSPRPRFPDFLARFDGVMLSGDEGMKKPDRAFYRAFLTRFGLNAAESVFIDDRLENVNGAAEEGIRPLFFTTASQTRHDLQALGVL